ncbi:hypothetical protein [Segetibacter koreensis]|uniref:hypothetical protein n=1 Tax=Segetibacter koreensis TaxID=398037 RepID=UPI00036AC0CF|nr:hypothetical protein [Segetibacter koreensis]
MRNQTLLFIAVYLKQNFPGVELLSLKAWLQQHGITHVGLESTGVYWKPVLYVLGEVFPIILAKARHIKYVPGRKTLISAPSFINSVRMRELKKLRLLLHIKYQLPVGIFYNVNSYIKTLATSLNSPILACATPVEGTLLKIRIK